jgi:hypothetical protein
MNISSNIALNMYATGLQQSRARGSLPSRGLDCSATGTSRRGR